MRAHLLKQAWPVVCLTLSLVFGLYAEAGGSGPIAVIEESTFNFKEVKEGTTVQHVFRVFNKGDQALEIKNVKPS